MLTSEIDHQITDQPADWHGQPCEWGCGEREVRGPDGEYRYATPNPVTTNVLVTDEHHVTEVRSTCSDLSCIQASIAYAHWAFEPPIVEQSTCPVAVPA